MAAVLSGFTTSATAMTPSSRPPAAIYSGVLPSAASASACCSTADTSTDTAAMYPALPAHTVTPSAVAVTPPPATAVKSATSRSVRPRCSASATIAPANGCSDGFSSDAAAASSVFSSTPGAHSRSVTRG